MEHANIAENQQPPASSSPLDAKALCNRIPEIQIFPMKGEKGADPIYDDFMAAGDRVIPCLIEQVTDTKVITDPRQEPGYPDLQTRVGDIAYFLIVDITKLEFTRLLPTQVQKRYKSDGVYAYFEWVANPANRITLRDSFNDWYRKSHAIR